MVWPLGCAPASVFSTGITVPAMGNEGILQSNDCFQPHFIADTFQAIHKPNGSIKLTLEETRKYSVCILSLSFELPLICQCLFDVLIQESDLTQGLPSLSELR